MTPAGSTIRIAVRTGARVRWTTPRRDRERLVRLEHDGVRVLDVDLQLPREHEEELVLDVVLVPVEVALDHAEAHDRVVDPS